MISLFIATANTINYIALLEDNKLIAKLQIKPEEKNISGNALPTIDELLKKSNKAFKDLNEIIVIHGPGSFTGIRVGITIAKVAAWTLNIKIKSISSLQYLASLNKNNEVIIPIIVDRNKNVYAGVYNGNLEKLQEDTYTNIDEFLKIIKKKYKKYVVVSQDDLEIENVKPDYDIENLLRKIENINYQNPHNVNPVYIKNTDAENRFQQSD